MKKLHLQTPNFTDEHIAKIAEIFPHCVTEAEDENGSLTRVIDFDLLKQELSENIVEGPRERYRLEWPGKRASLIAANAPITKTLRPAREESVDFDTTQNLYIEGDNLEALKLLQKSYLGAVKMIYIDPPYNTGKDFVYKDNFARSREEELRESGQIDEEGGRLVANLESNGRFHSDWLSMMYPRLRLARNLLRDDGVIFISIDDNEVHNLRKICDEVFGEENFVATLPTIMNLKGNNDEFGFAGTHEYTVVYIKNKGCVEDLYGIPLEEDDIAEYTLKDDIGFYKKGATLMRTGEAGARSKRPKGYYPIYVDKTLSKMSTIRMNHDDYEVYPKTQNGKEMSWRRSKQNLENTLNEFIITGTKDNIAFYKKQRLDEVLNKGKKPKTLFYKPKYSSGNGTTLLKKLFNDRIFDNPKPLDLIKDFVSIGSRDGIILDFFSGSATTAHAVMQLNAEDGGKRKFIMVQLPEETDEKSEAYKAGYRTIAEIGKERIRRAGRKIKEENAGKEGIDDLDIGFRVLKIDSANMKDVYYRPDEVSRESLLDTIDHIKEDRSAEDLLFGVLVDWGVDLTLPIERRKIAGKSVYFVGHDDLAACFEENLDEDFIKALAQEDVLRVVFKESGFANDETKSNAEQIFRQLAPGTDVRVI